MPRQPTALRLKDLDIDALVLDFEETLAAHVARLALPLSPGYALHLSPRQGDTSVGSTLRDLATYARDGEPLDGPTDDYLLELATVLNGPLGVRSSEAAVDILLAERTDVDELHEELPDRLALVCAAALAREAVEGEEDVPVARLAALGGSSGRLVRAEVIAHERGLCTAKEARRWLEGRGVKLPKPRR